MNSEGGEYEEEERKRKKEKGDKAPEIEQNTKENGAFALVKICLNQARADTETAPDQ